LPERYIEEILEMPSEQLMDDCIVRRSFVLDLGERGDPTYSNPVYDFYGYELVPHPRSVQDDPVTLLVALGHAAVPALLQHLLDDRSTKWHRFTRGPGTDMPEFDYNPLNTRLKPDAFKAGVQPRDLDYVPLGNVCFFALGQIVNRDYRLIMGSVNAPVYSEWASTEWKGLTKDGLVLSLQRDVLRGDTLSRRAGAVLRLKHYAPDKVVPTSLKAMGLPVEFLNSNILEYYFEYGAPYRSPNFLFADEFEAVLGALASVDDPRIDAFCDRWIREHLGSWSARDNKAIWLMDMTVVCARRLMMHTRRFDSTLKDLAGRLRAWSTDWARKDGQWILDALDSPDRFTWSDPKWFNKMPGERSNGISAARSTIE
jgi:hypothetical protein